MRGLIRMRRCDRLRELRSSPPGSKGDGIAREPGTNKSEGGSASQIFRKAERDGPRAEGHRKL